MVFPEFAYRPSLSMALTGKCSLVCKHCFASEIPKENMDFKIFERTILDYCKLYAGDKYIPGLNNLQFKISNVPRIILYGGEPTLHPEFRRFLLFALKHGRVLVDTNATQFPLTIEELRRDFKYLKIREEFEKIKQYKNVEFMISLDHLHHSQFKGQALEHQELRILTFLKFAIENKIDVFVNVVDQNAKIQNPELKEMLEAIKHFKYSNIHTTDPRQISSGGRNKPYNYDFIDLYEVNKYSFGLDVMPNGLVFLEGNDTYKDDLTKSNFKYVGDLKRENISAILERVKRRILIRSVTNIKEFRNRYISLNKAHKSLEKMWETKWFNNNAARTKHRKRIIAEMKAKLLRPK